MKKPLISISCITYNHEPYIRAAMDGFLMQKTEFPYEILIHDDASTDHTQEILREYEAKYPDRIKAIYRTENQYSKGICNVSGAFNFPRAEGKYIAMCEGDDYWTDPYKLQKQAEYMESHPDCAMCFHAAKIISESDAFVRKEIRPYRASRIVPTEEVISKPFNYPTASLFFRTELGKTLPKWYHDCPIGDVPIHLFTAAHGSVYYFDEYMSVYRLGVASSWTTGMQKGSEQEIAERHRRHLSNLEKMYRAFDETFSLRYHAAVEAAISRDRFLTELNLQNFEAVRDRKNRPYMDELPQPQRFLTYLQAYCPKLYQFIRKCYYGI